MNFHRSADDYKEKASLWQWLQYLATIYSHVKKEITPNDQYQDQNKKYISIYETLK